MALKPTRRHDPKPAQTEVGAARAELPAPARQEKINQPDAFFETLSKRLGRTTSQVVIGGLDLGFAVNTPSIKDNLYPNLREVPGDRLDNDGNGKIDDVLGWNFVTNSGRLEADPRSPVAYHGTSTFSLASANTDRIKGVLATAVGTGNPDAVAASIDYLAERGAKIVNISVGWSSAPYVTKVRAALARHPNVLFVVSAGNDFQKLGTKGRLNLTTDNFFASTNLPNMIVVAAAVDGDRLHDESNFGKEFVSVGALTEAAAARPDGTFNKVETTSFATPTVANLTAKAAILDPELTPAQLKAVVMLSSRKVPSWTELAQSGGLVDHDQALWLAAVTAAMRKPGATSTAVAKALKIPAAQAAELFEMHARLPKA